MADMHFGFQQIAQATPAVIGRIRLVLNFFSGGVVAFLPFIAQEMNTTTDRLTTWMGIFMLCFNSISLMFGVPITGKTVPSEDVTEMKTNKT